MYLAFTLILFATCYSLCGCIEESHFVPKVGVSLEEALKKHDLSAADAELIKSLMAKLEYGAGEADLLHKSADKEYYLHGPEMIDKAHFAEGKEADMKYLGKSVPIEHEYKLAKEGHGIKVDIGVEEKEMAAFLAKMKELGIVEDEYKKDIYYGTSGEKFLSEDAHFAEEAAKKEMSRKMYDEALKSKEAYDLGKGYGYDMDKGIYETKAHGFGEEVGIGKSLHGIVGEEALKAKESHGLAYDFEMEKGMYGGKAHGLGAEIGIEKALHGIAGEEALKSKSYGPAFDFEMDKKVHGAEVGFGGDVKHAVGHDVASTFGAGAEKGFKIYEDELIKKDKAYGADSLFLKEKGISDVPVDPYMHGVRKDEEARKFYEASADKHLIAGKEEVIGAEKSHRSFEDPKAKFFELLRRIIHTRKCHLVTMEARELLGIVNCVSTSKDPLLCEKFSACEKKMPFRVIKALEKCQKETIPGEVKRCSRYEPLYPTPVIPLKIFQCMAIAVGELVHPEEKKEMVSFEECARMLKAESCGRYKWAPVH